MESGTLTKSGSNLIPILGGLELILIGATVYFMSKLVGTTDTNNNLSKIIIPIVGSIGGIILLHTIMWFLYFTYEPLTMSYYFLVSIAMNFIISFTALAISIANSK